MRVCRYCGGKLSRLQHSYCSKVCVQRHRALRQQTKRFEEDLQQLPARVMRDDLLAIFREIYWRGYHAGQQGRIRQVAA